MSIIEHYSLSEQKMFTLFMKIDFSSYTPSELKSIKRYISRYDGSLESTLRILLSLHSHVFPQLSSRACVVEECAQHFQIPSDFGYLHPNSEIAYFPNLLAIAISSYGEELKALVETLVLAQELSE
ncbi:hypothetical protein HC928_00025 [bacterium]|nr:hypothetical protein [bacterium]